MMSSNDGIETLVMTTPSLPPKENGDSHPVAHEVPIETKAPPPVESSNPPACPPRLEPTKSPMEASNEDKPVPSTEVPATNDVAKPTPVPQTNTEGSKEAEKKEEKMEVTETKVVEKPKAEEKEMSEKKDDEKMEVEEKSEEKEKEEKKVADEKVPEEKEKVVEAKKEEEKEERKETPKVGRKRKKREESTTEIDDSLLEKVGSLEEPAVIEDGVKRARKKVQRLSDALDKSLAEREDKQQPKVPEGSGVPLGDIEYISHMLKTSKVDKLKVLYILIIGRRGAASKTRLILRQFRGFDFTEDSADYDKKLKHILTKKLPELKEVAKILGMQKLPTVKEEMAKEILNFLMKPHDLGRNAPKGKRGRKSKGKGKGPGKGKGKKTAGDSSDDDNEDEDEEGDEEEDNEEKDEKKEDEDEDEDEEEEKEEEEEEEKPKKKKAKATPKKAKAKETKKTPKKTPKATKRKSKSKAAADDDISDLSDSDDDAEPSSKKAKKMPTDEELKKTVLGLLDNVDLEKVTMKNVLQQIYEKYEGLDLTHKKEYLKSVVKDILSS